MKSGKMFYIHRFLTIFFSLIYFFLSAQSGDLSNQIPDALTVSADAVVLGSYQSAEVFSDEKMRVQVKKKIVIYNREARDLADIVLFYNPFTKIKYKHVVYADMNGKPLKILRSKDWNDVAASGHQTLYSDERALVYQYTPVSYPFTVTVEYTYETSNTAFVPAWDPVPGEHVSVVKSTYVLHYPTSMRLFKKERFPPAFHVEKNEHAGYVKYVLTGAEAVEKEPLGPAWDEIVPYARLRLNRFSLAGVKGKADNWEEFGRWMSTRLLAGRDRLPEERVHEIRRLTASVKDPLERAKKVYEFMQNRTRYVNVAIGIGGWQPMTAAEVDRLGYGDCKALTNYTKALLDAAGVPSVYTVAYAGYRPRDIDPGLVGVQGNHVFLGVLNRQDTVWIECTSQKIPFGHISGFTDSRKVLTIEPLHSKIVQTPVFPPETNLQKTEAEVQLDENTDLHAQVHMESSGTRYDMHLQHFDDLPPGKLKEAAARFFDGLRRVKIEKIEVKNDKQGGKYVENIRLSVPYYARRQEDGALVIRPNVFNLVTFVPKRIKERKYPLVITRGYRLDDRYVVHLPGNYNLDNLPGKIEIKSEFGTYTATFTKTGPNTFVYHRVFTLNAGRFPKEKYEQYRKFRRKIKKLETKKILIQKQK